MEEQSGDYWEMEENRSEGDNGRKMSWVLDKGIIGLGKKILFTGFLISSAPLALPPLVVISAIGLVVSIPSGIFLASYACSEKLMRKLLPIPEQEEEEEEAIGEKRKMEEILEDKNVEAAEEENGIVEVGVESDRENVLGETVAVEESDKEREKENGVEDKEIEKGSVEETKNEGKPADEDKTTREISTSKDNQSAASAAKGDQSAVTTNTELPVSHGTEATKDQAEISSEKADQTTPSNSEAKKKKSSVKKKPAASGQQQQTQKVSQSRRT